MIMKKRSAALICTALLLALSGCSPQDKLRNLVTAGDPEAETRTSQSPRVYMDEIYGTVKEFSGNQLTLFNDPDTYIFDVSQADLECKNGIITGDQVNVIYEGQLSGTDTNTVRALKVVDAYHNKPELEKTRLVAQIQSLTANSVTLKSKDGKTAVYPITGTEQYYQKGIKTGKWVYLYYQGSFGEPQSEDSSRLNASHLKVLSISDVDPMKVPAPTPTPKPQEGTETVREQKLRAKISGVNLPVLQVIPDHSKTVLKVDMSSIPCHFSGGITIGAKVNITYTGSFNGTTTEGMTILGVTGDIPEKQNSSSVSYTVSGEITASTANTITILSPDGMYLTFRTDSAVNSSTGGLLTGSNVKLTFNPADSRNSNIYTCLRIEDA